MNQTRITPARPGSKCALACGVALALIGCSTPGGKNQGPIYEPGRQIDSLIVPPELAGPEMNRSYRIPEERGDRISAREFERGIRADPGIATGRAAVLPETPEVQLRRDANTRWLYVATTPDALWPQLQEFWRSQNLALARNEPLVGIMETEWAENRAGIPLGTTRRLLARAVGTLYDAGTRDQYRLRVERANGATEVFITHRGAAEEGGPGGEGSRWFIGDPNPELEAEMLNRLLVFLTTGTVTAGAVAPEQIDFERTGQVDLVERDGQLVLSVWGEPDALWRRLGLALDRTGLLIDEQDRRSGTFLVTYRPDIVEARESRGLFGRIFRTGRAARSREDQRYQIRMLEDGRDLQILALSIDGAPLRPRDARFVLELIQPQLR